MRKILGKICIIAAMVTAMSVGIDSLYRYAYGIPYPIPRNILPLPEIKEKFRIVKVGNSHALEGITFDRYRVKSLDLTGSAQSFEYDLANLKMHARQIEAGAVILVTVSPISFSQSKPGKKDSLQTVYYDGRLSPFLIPQLKVEDYLQSQITPFFRAGFLWRKTHNDRIKDRLAREITWPTPSPAAEASAAALTSSAVSSIPLQPAADKPRDKDFFNAQDIGAELAAHTVVSESAVNKLKDSMFFTFDRWYRTEGFGTQYFESNRRDLATLIGYCQKKKWRPVLVTIPISKLLQDGLLPDYMQVNVYDNIAKTDLRGTDYFDFTPLVELTGDNFLYRDSDHLNSQGAAAFSYLLLRKLIDTGYLPSDVDGYDYSSHD